MVLLVHQLLDEIHVVDNDMVWILGQAEKDLADDFVVDAIVNKVAESAGSEQKARRAVEKVFNDLGNQYGRADIITALESDVGAAAKAAKDLETES